LIVYLLTRPPPSSSLFPYTTLFRSPCRHPDSRVVPKEGFARHLVKKPGGVRPQCGVSPQRRSVVRLHLLPRSERSALPAHRNHRDRKSTRLNSSHLVISYAVFCLKK